LGCFVTVSPVAAANKRPDKHGDNYACLTLYKLFGLTILLVTVLAQYDGSLQPFEGLPLQGKFWPPLTLSARSERLTGCLAQLAARSQRPAVRRTLVAFDNIQSVGCVGYRHAIRTNDGVVLIDTLHERMSIKMSATLGKAEHPSCRHQICAAERQAIWTM